MLLEALFLVATLGRENARNAAAAAEVERMKKDDFSRRARFLEDQKRWRKDIFAFSWECNDFQRDRILSLLNLVDEGYFPVCYAYNTKRLEENLKRDGLENCTYKKVMWSTCASEEDALKHDYFEYYLKISDAMDFFERGGSCKNWTDDSQYRFGMSLKSALDAMKESKVIIGSPRYVLGIPDEYEPQAMTTAEARNFMNKVMEERFQAQSIY